MINVLKPFLVYIVAAFIIISVGIVAYTNHVEAKEEAEKVRIENEQIEAANKALTSLYGNSEKNTLSSDITFGSILGTEKLVREIVSREQAREAFQVELDNIKVMFQGYSILREIVDGDILKDDVSQEQLDEVSKAIEKVSSISIVYYDSLKGQFDLANEQFKGIISAKEKVQSAEKSLERKSYDEAMAAINQIKNVKAKEELGKSLEAVLNKIVAKEEEQSRKIVEETKQETVGNQNTGSSNKTTVSNGSTTKAPSSNKSTSTSTKNKSTSTTSGGTSSKTSGGSKSIEMEDVKKTGEGEIEGSGGSRTYEEGTFTVPSEYWNNK